MSDKEGPIRPISPDSVTSETTMTSSLDRESVTGDSLSFDNVPELAPSNDPPQPPPLQQDPLQDQSAAQPRGGYARLPTSPEPVFPGQENLSNAEQKGEYVRLTRPKEAFPGSKTSSGPKEARVRHSSGPLVKNPKEKAQTIKEDKERLLPSSSSEESSEILPPQQTLEAASGKGKSRSFSLQWQYDPKTAVRQESPSKTPVRRKSEGQVDRIKMESSPDSPKKRSPLKEKCSKLLKHMVYKKDAKGKKGTEKQSRSKKEHKAKVDDPGLTEASTSAAGPSGVRALAGLAEASTSAAGPSGVRALAGLPEASKSEAGPSGVRALEEESDDADENPNVRPQRVLRTRSYSKACRSPSKRKASDD